MRGEIKLKIGIVVYSQTGNTYSVASKLYERLLKENRFVSIDKIEATRDEIKKSIHFNKTPDPSKYEAIVFCSPVEAFSLCPVMKSYLENIKSLKGKKVACFVTQFFPYPWMGGNNAIRQMSKICNDKGAEICGTGVINWKNKHREKMIENLIDNLTHQLKKQ